MQEPTLVDSNRDSIGITSLPGAYSILVFAGQHAGHHSFETLQEGRKCLSTMRKVATHGLHALARVYCGNSSVTHTEAVFRSLVALSAARDAFIRSQFPSQKPS